MKPSAITIAVTLCLTGLSAQSGPAPTSSSYTQVIKSRWNTIKRNVASSAAAMTDANYGFKPVPEVRSFGELIGHLANEHYLFCSQAKGEPNPQEGVDFEKKTAKADLVKAINDSIAYCDAIYTALKDEPKTIAPIAPGRTETPFSTLTLNVTHDSEHYGNLVTYLRIKGVVPPSSQPSR